MQTIWINIRKLIARGNVRISEHGYDELAEDGLTVREIINGSPEAIVWKSGGYCSGGVSGLFKRTMCLDSFEGQGEPTNSCRLGHSTWLINSGSFSHGISA